MYIMTATSIGRIMLPVLALAAAGGAALMLGRNIGPRDPPVQATAAASRISPPASAAPYEASAPLGTARAEANAAAVALASASQLPLTDDPVLAFDIARVERTGEAVIAGRAAPGARVELLRNGERLDQAVASESGQFAMVPPRLPAGSYELTLRSRQPDGREAVSKQRVAVVVDKMDSDTRVAGMPLNIPQARRQDDAVSQLRDATAAIPEPDRGSPSAQPVPRSATTVVSRGDSLWRISRANYGAGLRYSDLYKANRDRIRNPDLIYPGQTLIVPQKIP